jgi:hypothetical protein
MPVILPQRMQPHLGPLAIHVSTFVSSQPISPYVPVRTDSERMSVATGLIEQLVAVGPPLPSSLADLDGEWELIFTDVAHGIFRSSPFFLAIQEAYAREGEAEKAE